MGSSLVSSVSIFRLRVEMGRSRSSSPPSLSGHSLGLALGDLSGVCPWDRALLPGLLVLRLAIIASVWVMLGRPIKRSKALKTLPVSLVTLFDPTVGVIFCCLSPVDGEREGILVTMEGGVILGLLDTMEGGEVVAFLLNTLEGGDGLVLDTMEGGEVRLLNTMEGGETGD
jgi:hypothetical protein